MKLSNCQEGWVAAVLLGMSCLSGQAGAQAPKPAIPVYLDPAQSDADFPFQGEYAGWQRSQPSRRSSEAIGLQVIALGEGKFAGTKYYGGLPGDGWFGGERFPLEGERTSDVVLLRGGRYEVEIQHGAARLLAADGRVAGELRRVERISPTMGTQPPAGAIVLFDGSNTDRLSGAKMTPDGLLMSGTETAAPYGDFRLHAEFYLPYKPLGRGQDRGNSGLYLQSRYEVQVLDSFGLEGVENECGSLYRTKRPDVNMCFPPLQWQTYDIDFTSAKFDASGKKIADMQITVYHNGYPVQDHAQIPNKTGAGQPEGPAPLITKIQDHGNPVLFRNIWLIEKSNSEAMSQVWLKLPIHAAPVPIRSFSPPIAVLPVAGMQSIRFGCP